MCKKAGYGPPFVCVEARSSGGQRVSVETLLDSESDLALPHGRASDPALADVADINESHATPCFQS